MTSVVAGVVGLGGGMILIALLPGLVPANAIVALHSITQLASNGSRTLLAIKHVQWRVLPPFFIGSVVGVAIFAWFFYNIPAHYIPPCIGVYILLSLWSTPFNRLLQRYESFYLAGFLQTGLGLVVGATGPLASTLLTKTLKCSEQIIATMALTMLATHVIKITTFVLTGFSYMDYLWVSVAMVFGAIVGTWTGTLIRRRFDGRHLKNAIKWMLTLLAIKMVLQVLWA